LEREGGCLGKEKGKMGGTSLGVKCWRWEEVGGGGVGGRGLPRIIIIDTSDIVLLARDHVDQTGENLDVIFFLEKKKRVSP
jgi:hypothetical protein